MIGLQWNFAGVCVITTGCGGRNVVANEVELRGWQLICHSSPRKSQVIAQDKTSQSSEITGRVAALKRNGLDTSTECAYKVIRQVNAIWEQGKQVEGVNLLMLNQENIMST